MAVTLTYEPVLSRVRITATGLGAADTALVERSTDQIRWTTVRGGSAWAVVAGSFVTILDDYEFSPGVLNYYRVSGVESAAITFVALGTSGTGNNASVTPTLPAGLVAGDLMLLLADIRNSGAGTVNTPTGWTPIVGGGTNFTLFARRYVAGDTNPTVSFTGGVANADTLARIAAWRSAGDLPITVSPQLNASAQNIAYPLVNNSTAGALAIVAGWKQDDWTSVATLAGMTEINENISVVGDDSAHVWDYQIQTTAAAIPAGSFVVTGGAAAISRAMVALFPHAPYLQQQTNSITPGQTGIWLKSIPRPFLNQAVEVVWRNPVTITSPARVGIFDIVGRTMPVAVNDLRSSRRWVMYLRTTTDTDAANLRILLASGDALLIQVPPECADLVPAGYVSVGDVAEEWHPLRPVRRTFTLPLTEVAAPGPDVVGVAVTWQTVLNTYGSWADVMAAKATWADLLALVGTHADVIVA